jgi:putative transposase
VKNRGQNTVFANILVAIRDNKLHEGDKCRANQDLSYLEFRPIRTIMVSHPGEYPWSRYACNASGQHNPLISAHPLYNALGNEAPQRHDTYRELFCMPMDHRQIHAIREALNQEWVRGQEDFKDKIERMSKRQVRPGQPGRPRVEEEQAVYYVL